MIVGVLAVQGDFAEHISVLDSLGVETVEVRLPKDLVGVNAIIIPGGESTTIRRLLDLYDLSGPIISLVAAGTPVWGTCAGMIMLAKNLIDSRPEPLRLMDITVARNAFGRQVDSFEADLDFPILGEDPFHAIFIRAPAVSGIGKDVKVLGRLDENTPVALLQNHMLVTSFHPELTADSRFHQFFLTLVESRNV